MAQPLRGGGAKGPATKEKRTFFYIFIYFSPKIVENFFFQNQFFGYFKTKKKSSYGH